jgi:membrane-associated protein
MHGLIDIFLHLDDKIIQVVQAFGPWSYLLLFLVVFCETGLIIFPFLPGDSLLFAAGMVSNPDHRSLSFWLVAMVFVSAAIVGDSVNFWIGRKVGERLFSPHRSPLLNRMFKRSHLEATQRFFDRHGARTVLIGRFIPVVRTLTPFVAGQTMGYRRFLRYSILGSFLWVGICCGAGYLFGQIPWVEKNFSLTILIVAGGTILLGIWEVVRSSRHQGEVTESKNSA